MKARRSLTDRLKALESTRRATTTDGAAGNAAAGDGAASDAAAHGDAAAGVASDRCASASGEATPTRGFLPLAERHLPVECKETATGAWVRCVTFPLTHRHGGSTLAEGLAADPEALAVAGRSPALASVDPATHVFFDTETTSLAGGAGIYLFLIGLGFVRGDSFVLEQYFLRDVGEERAMLEAVRQRLREAAGVVSYAGSTFDHPRLRDRLALCGLGVPEAPRGAPEPVIPPELHLDLLHPARALWRAEQPDVKLGTLERTRIEFYRQDDLPGALCPVAYFDYLCGRPRTLPRVFEHNAHDVLSMVVLLRAIAAAVRRPSSASELLGAARLAAHASDRTRERDLLEEAWRRVPTQHPLRATATLRLALARKRSGERAAAGELWRELTGHRGHAARAWIELAIVLEHDEGAFDAALAATRRAFDLLRTARAPRAKLEAVAKRERRLLARTV